MELVSDPRAARKADFARRSDLGVARLPGLSPELMTLALAQLPGCLRQARRQFRQLTGLVAVTSLIAELRHLGHPSRLPPPVHPRCAALFSEYPALPCFEQWKEHVRESLDDPHGHTHVCPMSLTCSCIPVFLGKTLVGVAKLVMNGETSASEVRAATASLALTVSLSCQECYASIMERHVETLEGQVSSLRKLNLAATEVESATAEPGAQGLRGRTPTVGSRILDQAIDYIHENYTNPGLSLRDVAVAVGGNPKYVTNLFSKGVGERMRSYIIRLRVNHACRELMHTDYSVKRIAFDCGFADPAQLRRACQRYVGTSPSLYRRVFGSVGDCQTTGTSIP